MNTNPGEVHAKFNYTKEVDKLTEIYFYESEAAKDTHEPGDNPREMAVNDGVSRAQNHKPAYMFHF